MIYVRLAGGLGNQLFQLAAAAALSKRSDMPVQLLLGGLTSYRTTRQPDIIRLIDLTHLNARVGVSTGVIAWASVSARAGRFVPVLGVSDRNFARTLAQPRIRNHLLLLDGYFQRQWRWDQFAPVLMSLREAMFNRWKTVPMPDADCVVHVRGGDFLRSPEHQVVNDRYYADALGLLLEHRDVARALVVTDDPAHAERILECSKATHPAIEFKFAERAEDPLDDFAMLANTPSRVIGNSTFSWWASLLSPHQGTTVSPSRFVRGQTRPVGAPWEITLSVD